MNAGLSDADFRAAADRIGCDVAAVRAVCKVESPKGPFNPDGSPTTLFEGHKFHLYTGGRFDATHPDLSYKHWTRAHYGRTWELEQQRLERAMALDAHAALMSTSWGQFQIMGFNHGPAGFATVEAFVDAMRESAARQLEAFVSLVIEWGLGDELQDHRWADFARRYNGPAYADNRYDVKMAAAYKAMRGIA